MSLNELLAHYGYAVVLVGTFLEGETVLIMAGFAAHQGYLQLPWVMVAAFAGSLLGDQAAFFSGRRYGRRLLARFDKLAVRVERATALLARRGTPLLVGFRFLYGIRNVTPIAAGLSGVSALRFAMLNAIGALLWSVSVSAAGYGFGHGLELAVERAKHYEARALLALCVAGLAGALLVRIRRREKRLS